MSNYYWLLRIMHDPLAIAVGGGVLFAVLFALYIASGGNKSSEK